MVTDDLRQRRLALIREHMDTEVTKEGVARLQRALPRAQINANRPR